MQDVKWSEVDNTKQQLPQEKKKSKFKKFMQRFLLVFLLFFGIFIWWQYFYVFGIGVKSGTLNYVVKKGNIFKTYEGKLIQSGFRSRTPGSIGSETFEFSIVSDSIATVLMNNSGKSFDLHYREYKNALPWRGYTPFVVDRIISMRTPDPLAP